jgi:hypothetical protein
MSRIEARLDALETAARDTRFDERRMNAAARYLRGTATIDDYEEFWPGLLHYTVRVIAFEAMRVRLRCYPQYAPVVPRHELLDTPHEERLRLLHLEVLYSYPPGGDRHAMTIRSLTHTMPPYWLELLDGHTGPELTLVAAHCSYLTTETPLSRYLDKLAAIDDGDDRPARQRAHLYHAAISGGYEQGIRLAVEANIAEWFLEQEGTAGRGERFARTRGATCRGSQFDCYHDRLPPTCYDRATAQACRCHDQPRSDTNDTEDRTAHELVTIKHTLGVRSEIPDQCRLERVWTTHPAYEDL